MIQRFLAGHPAAPSGIAIIASGETAETFCQHYYDSRGVARIYQVSLNDGVWKLWREAPASGSATPGCSLATQDDQGRLGGLGRRVAVEA